MRINIRHRLIISGDDRMRFARLGVAGIHFTSRNEHGSEAQEHYLMVTGDHAKWLTKRNESLEIHQADVLQQAWLEFRDEFNACEFKLRFL